MNRTVEWGHWGITFYLDGRAQAAVSFPCGPQGPCDGTIGSPERESWQNACRSWVERGELPEGAACYIDLRWLYDPRTPLAIWTEGRGWTSPVFVCGPNHGAWMFPEVSQWQQ